MPVGCPIQAIPNQEFSITLNGNVYDIGIGATAGVMSVSISLNGTLLVESLARGRLRAADPGRIP